jgi:hypothetical protein
MILGIAARKSNRPVLNSAACLCETAYFVRNT